MQNMDSDRIQQLIEAARDDERAKLAVEAILREIHRRLSELEDAFGTNTKELRWIKSVVQANYNNVATLIQLMAALWKGDRTSLSEIQQKIAEQAFLKDLKEESGINIDVDAQGDVRLSADRVGRDKKGKNNE